MSAIEARVTLPARRRDELRALSVRVIPRRGEAGGDVVLTILRAWTSEGFYMGARNVRFPLAAVDELISALRSVQTRAEARP